jgi:NADH-quinone oxidoreductase subunit H
MLSRSRPSLLAGVVALVALFLVACVRDGSPQLIQVLELAPHEAEIGDRIEILGNGFPQGKAAHLAFRGTLFRPGERPIEDTEVVAEGTVRNAQQIELAFTEAMQALFCGGAGQEIHTTFDGELEVAFTAASAGSPPIAATLYKVSLDIRPPPPRAAVAQAQDAEGERALRFVGIVASPELSQNGGLTIDKVEPGSRADQAGVVAGDVMVKLDGLRVATKADAVPPPGAQTVMLAVRRGSDPREQLKQVAVDGFKATAPSELLGAAILIALAVAIVLLFLAPSSGSSAWVERRFAGRVRAEMIARALPTDRAFWIVGGSVSALLIATPFGQYRVAASLDVTIVFLVLVSALLTAALVTGGGAPRWSIVGTARALWRIFSRHVPSALAVIGIVVVNGSLRVHDIVRAQGGAPWDWYVLKSPITLALFVAFIAGIFAEGDDLPSTLAEADAPPSRADSASETPRVRLFTIARHAGLFASCAVAVVLFLGGWQLPGLDPAQAGGSGSALLVGAALFVAKTWLLVFAVTIARRTLPSVRAEEAAAMTWKYFVPVALVAIALAAGWRLWSPPRALDRMASGVLFVLLLLFAVQLFQRVRYGLKSPHAHAHVNPFL